MHQSRTLANTVSCVVPDPDHTQHICVGWQLTLSNNIGLVLDLDRALTLHVATKPLQQASLTPQQLLGWQQGMIRKDHQPLVTSKGFTHYVTRYRSVTRPGTAEMGDLLGRYLKAQVAAGAKGCCGEVALVVDLLPAWRDLEGESEL